MQKGQFRFESRYIFMLVKKLIFVLQEHMTSAYVTLKALLPVISSLLSIDDHALYFAGGHLSLGKKTTGCLQFMALLNHIESSSPCYITVAKQ